MCDISSHLICVLRVPLAQGRDRSSSTMAGRKTILDVSAGANSVAGVPGLVQSRPCPEDPLCSPGPFPHRSQSREKDSASTTGPKRGSPSPARNTSTHHVLKADTCHFFLPPSFSCGASRGYPPGWGPGQERWWPGAPRLGPWTPDPDCTAPLHHRPHPQHTSASAPGSGLENEQNAKIQSKQKKSLTRLHRHNRRRPPHPMQTPTHTCGHRENRRRWLPDLT